MSTVFFDLETQNLLADVGGRKNVERLRLACAVTWSTQRGDFAVYWEANVEALIEELSHASRVIGFNIRDFDYRVLRPYAPHVNFAGIVSTDMLVDLERTLGFRIGLDALAAATLGETKQADGRAAVAWFRAGEREKLTAYCKRDVDITRRIFEYGSDNGHVLYLSRLGTKVKVVVPWQRANFLDWED